MKLRRKRILALILSAAMAFSFNMGALAAEPDGEAYEEAESEGIETEETAFEDTASVEEEQMADAAEEPAAVTEEAAEEVPEEAVMEAALDILGAEAEPAEVLPLAEETGRTAKAEAKGTVLEASANGILHTGAPVSENSGGWNPIEDPGLFRPAFAYHGIQSEHLVDGKAVTVSNNANQFQELLELNGGVISGNAVQLKDDYYMLIAYTVKDDGRTDSLSVDQATALNTKENHPVVTFSGRKYQGPQAKNSVKANNYIRVIASLIKYDPKKKGVPYDVIANTLSVNAKGKKEFNIKATAKNNLYASVSRNGNFEAIKTGFNKKGSPYFTIAVTAAGDTKKRVASAGLTALLKKFNSDMKKKKENRYAFEIRRAILAVSNNALTDPAQRRAYADTGEHDSDFKDGDTVIDGFQHHGFGTTNVASYRKKVTIKNDHYAAMNLKYKTVRFKNKDRLYAMKQTKKEITNLADAEGLKADYWTQVVHVGDYDIIVIRPLGNFEPYVSVYPAFRNVTYTNVKGKRITELRSGVFVDKNTFYVDSVE